MNLDEIDQALLDGIDEGFTGMKLVKKVAFELDVGFTDVQRGIYRLMSDERLKFGPGLRMEKA
jgi:hypothetical protein